MTGVALLRELFIFGNPCDHLVFIRGFIDRKESVMVGKTILNAGVLLAVLLLVSCNLPSATQ
ncbi:MAG TPA: hypothetical protein VMC09_06390, partial [Anaerolineales bacterium]|nr:hypothetical protein [Anaerolineales bacterium]